MKILRRMSPSFLCLRSKGVTCKEAFSGENQYECLADVVTPLWKLDYSEQLKIKMDWSKSVLMKMRGQGLFSMKTNIHKISRSPKVESYRNKDEFNVRFGIDGESKTVGFFVGSHAVGNVVCVPPTHLINIKREHIEVAQIYQEFLKQSSLPLCIDFSDGGYWRNILVRSSDIGDKIVICIANPRGYAYEVVQESKEKLANFFLSSGCLLKCLYFQLCPHTRCTGESHPFEILYGEPHLYEDVNEYTFRISPGSFFQVNTSAISSLYSWVLKFADLTKRSCLLDLCCGIGTLSILASKHVRECIGIDCSFESIQDAKFNASNNCVKNCSFVLGQVEKELGQALKNLEISTDLVAVLNPGRAGVGQRVIKTLRRSPIKRLVYVSCKADGPGAVKNFVDLCKPKFDSSPAFTLTDIKPIDMFPQTSHCELLLLFQR